MKSWLLFYAIFTLSSLSVHFKNKETHDSIQDQKYFGYYTGIHIFFVLFFFSIFLYGCYGDLVENLFKIRDITNPVCFCAATTIPVHRPTSTPYQIHHD